MLVLGRATNGYNGSFTVSELTEADQRARIIKASRTDAESTKEGPPLWWVNVPTVNKESKPGRKRRTGGTIGSRSAFWRVTRALLRVVTPASEADPNWASYLAWGNLAKIAPNVPVDTISEGANPCGSLADLQRDACIALLRQEVAELNPAVVLVIAGWWWTDAHTAGLGLTQITVPDAVHASKVAVEPNGRRWIFTDRPERKPQAPFVAEVLAALTYVIPAAN